MKEYHQELLDKGIITGVSKRVLYDGGPLEDIMHFNPDKFEMNEQSGGWQLKKEDNPDLLPKKKDYGY